jgi:hypothetical protein
MSFNSSEYAWSDLQIVMLGRKVIGARGIEYKASQEKEAIYASGNAPRGIGRGNKSYEGTLTVLQSELQALEVAAGKGNDILDLRNITITVAYAPTDGGQISTDILEFVEFTESSKSMKQNDKFMEIAIPFKCLNINKNV